MAEEREEYLSSWKEDDPNKAINGSNQVEEKEAGQREHGLKKSYRQLIRET